MLFKISIQGGGKVVNQDFIIQLWKSEHCRGLWKSWEPLLLRNKDICSFFWKVYGYPLMNAICRFHLWNQKIVFQFLGTGTYCIPKVWERRLISSRMVEKWEFWQGSGEMIFYGLSFTYTIFAVDATNIDCGPNIFIRSSFNTHEILCILCGGKFPYIKNTENQYTIDALA